MNLDEYFSKYIDAELSAEEDAAMRSLLADDAVARSEFEHAALLSVAMMREADEIDTPADLFDITEQSVLSRMHTSPESLPTLSRRRQSLTAVMLLFLIAFLGDSIRVGDGGIPRGLSVDGLVSQQIQPAQVDRHETFYSSGAVRHSNKKGPNTLQRSSTGEDGASPLAAAALNDASRQLSASSDNGLPVTQAPTYTFSSASSMISDLSQSRAMQPNVAQWTDESDVAGTAFARAPVKDPSSAVQFDSYVGNIVKTSASTGSAQHYSESIGYTVSEGVNMGLEVGSFAVVTAVPMQFGTSSALNELGDSKHHGSLNDAVDQSPSSGGSSGSQAGNSASASNVQSRNVVWGAAYVEPSLYKNSLVSVKARMGIGSSDGGPLVFARALSSVNVYGPLSLTIGTEGRAFLYTDKSSSGLDKTMQTMVSVMYGVQLKF